MPEETQVKEELKNEETTSTEAAPAEEKQEGQESIEEVKARLAKTEEERENYKNMALKYKKDDKEKTLEVEEEVYPEWNEDSKLFQKHTTELARKNAEEVSRRTTIEIVQKNNERDAIASEVKANPELSKDDVWQKVVKNLPPHSKDSVSEIRKAIGKAYVLYQYDEGTLGKKETKPDVSELGTVGRTTSKSTTEGKTLTQSEINIGKAMKVDLEKLAEEDMTKPATIEIN